MTAFEAAERGFLDHYAAWDAWAKTPGTPAPRLESNQVLATVRPGLEEAGYSVEKPGTKLPLTVLWGVNGKAEKSYHADAKQEHSPGRETVVEVEAGGATANNLWRKDLMEACVMPYVDYLAIAVRNEYRSLDTKKRIPRINADFGLVTSELDAIYESRRLQLPLLGILVVGY
ncbi:MAG: hypothetical protein WBM00_01630 [Solirubrobacterales bacterium]